jgi:hypothetical protein
MHLVFPFIHSPIGTAATEIITCGKEQQQQKSLHVVNVQLSSMWLCAWMDGCMSTWVEGGKEKEMER